MRFSAFSPSIEALNSFGIANEVYGDEAVCWIGKPDTLEYMYCFVPLTSYFIVLLLFVIPALTVRVAHDWLHWFYATLVFDIPLIMLAVIILLMTAYIARRGSPLYALTTHRLIISYRYVAPMIGVPETGKWVGDRIFYTYDIPLLVAAQVKFTRRGFGNIDFGRSISILGNVRADSIAAFASQPDSSDLRGSSRGNHSNANYLPVFKATAFPAPLASPRRERSSLIAAPEALRVGQEIARLLTVYFKGST